MPTAPFQPALPRHSPPPAPQQGHRPPGRSAWPTRRRELQLWDAGHALVAGVDEVGRGPIAGPVVAGAVCLEPRSRPDWLGRVRDSKQLSARARRDLAAAIKHTVPGWGVGWTAAEEIDSVGILQGTRLAMRRALADLAGRSGAAVDYVLVDGRDAHHFECQFETIVGGDASSTSIAAASIVAKVARDAWMETRAAAYPAYGFAANKGYATPGHLAALRRRGPCVEHRYSFAPVRASGRAALRPAPARLGF